MAKTRESIMTEPITDDTGALLNTIERSLGSSNGSGKGKGNVGKINANGNGDYGEQNIQILEGLEAGRVRPGMYIGATDHRGPHHLITQVVDNSIDESRAGYAATVKVATTATSSVTTQTNG